MGRYTLTEEQKRIAQQFAPQKRLTLTEEQKRIAAEYDPVP
jgi:hypothetical protein